MARVLAAIIILAISLFACGQEQQKPAGQTEQKQVRKSAATEPQKSEVVAAQKEETKVESETYLYDPKGRRDPFLSIIDASKKEQEAEKKKKGLKPLEANDLSAIKVLAIAWDKKKHFAMVQFTDNKYYTVREGMTLGAYGGKVIRIDENSVVVRETMKDYKGELQHKDTILKLRKEEGE
ncbi:MAG TPA: pilus assembly protein PilP [Thermodesulfovibrionales bacterium]|nr:pilus assembly protein PilP [Thermodesulfovibrionales bacterium]